MTFYVSWAGFGSEFPGLKSTASLPPEGLDDPGASHLEEVDALLQAYAADHPDERLQVTLSGHAQTVETGTHSTLSLSLTTSPAVKEETAVDVSKSQDPFAPDLPAEAEKPAEVTLDPDPQQGGPGGQSADSLAQQERTDQTVTAQQPAEPAPVNTPEGSDVSEPAEGTEAQDAPAIASAGEEPTAAPEETETALEHPPVEDPADAPEPAPEAPAADPTAPAESAGPTEPTTTEEHSDAVPSE